MSFVPGQDRSCKFKTRVSTVSHVMTGVGACAQANASEKLERMESTAHEFRGNNVEERAASHTHTHFLPHKTEPPPSCFRLSTLVFFYFILFFKSVFVSQSQAHFSTSQLFAPPPLGFVLFLSFCLFLCLMLISVEYKNTKVQQQ